MGLWGKCCLVDKDELHYVTRFAFFRAVSLGL